MNIQNENRESLLLRTVVNSCHDIIFNYEFVMTYHNKSIPEVIRYDRVDMAIKFTFGPPEYHVEMSLINKTGESGEREYRLSDLIYISEIDEWMRRNRLVTTKENQLRDEIVWYCRLLKTFIFNASKANSMLFARIDGKKEANK